MQSLSVVVVDVGEYVLAGLGAGGPDTAADLGFQCGEERLGDRVVPALPTPADRELDAVRAGEAGVLNAGVLLRSE